MANWHYEQNGQPTGPVSEDELRRLAAAGAVTPATRVWAEGMGDWQAASAALPALFGGTPVYTAPTPAAHATPTGGAFGGPVAIENQLVKAILVTLFCCLPFGIVSIIKASEANNKAAAGDAMGANAANAEASKWIKYGVIGGVVVYGLYALMMVGTMMAGMAGN